jgi:hypothetical protein
VSLWNYCNIHSRYTHTLHLNYCPYNSRRRDSSVIQRWAMGWMIGGSSPGRGWEFFSSPPRPDRLWAPPSLLSNGYEGLFSRGIKRQGREANHSHPSSAESRMLGAILPFPQYAFMVWCSDEIQEQLYLYHVTVIFLVCFTKVV